ncbi:MAG: hypothetical protein ACHEUT_11285 [Corynebacterium pyruviciproducens]|uniref:hypothetical protein n=1 Tax=Corynebacterium pyruviciproducens TaxID=598660 RepID=UPI003983170C
MVGKQAYRNLLGANFRDVHLDLDEVEAEDPISTGILEDFIQQLEQQAWFISAEAQILTQG